MKYITDEYFEITNKVLTESILDDITNKAKSILTNPNFNFLVSKIKKLKLNINTSTVLKSSGLPKEFRNVSLIEANKAINSITRSYSKVDRKNLSLSNIRKDAENIVNNIFNRNKRVEISGMRSDPGQDFKKDEMSEIIDTKLLNTFIIFFMFIILVVVYLLNGFTLAAFLQLPIYKIIFYLVLIACLGISMLYLLKSYSIKKDKNDPVIDFKKDSLKDILTKFLQKVTNRIIYFYKLLKEDRFFIEVNTVLFIVFPVGLLLTKLTGLLFKLNATNTFFGAFAVGGSAITISVLLFFLSYQLVIFITGINHTRKQKKDDQIVDDGAPNKTNDSTQTSYLEPSGGSNNNNDDEKDDVFKDLPI
jgi:hypothetical protein